jgi:hypothetical protein
MVNSGQRHTGSAEFYTDDLPSVEFIDYGKLSIKNGDDICVDVTASLFNDCQVIVTGEIDENDKYFIGALDCLRLLFDSNNIAANREVLSVITVDEICRYAAETNLKSVLRSEWLEIKDKESDQDA